MTQVRVRETDTRWVDIIARACGRQVLRMQGQAFETYLQSVIDFNVKQNQLTQDEVGNVTLFVGQTILIPTCP